MVKEKKVKRVVLPVPASLEEVADYVRRIGGYQRALTLIQARTNERIEAIKAQATTDCIPHQDEIEALFEGVYIFAQSHRNELTEGGKKKTVNLPTGDVCWRMTPPAVSIKDEAEVLLRLKEMKLQRFIRPKEEPDKEAMLKEPEVAKSIKGITISQHEEFVVKPSETNIEIPRKIPKKNKGSKKC